MPSNNNGKRPVDNNNNHNIEDKFSELTNSFVNNMNMVNELPEAVKLGDLEKVKLIFSSGGITRELAVSLIRIAASRGHLEIMKYLHKEQKIPLIKPDGNLLYDLWTARLSNLLSASKYTEILEWLLEEEQLATLDSGITKKHIQAALGRCELPISLSEQSFDNYGLTPQDYLIISGIHFIERGSQQKVFQNINTDKFSIGPLKGLNRSTLLLSLSLAPAQFYNVLKINPRLDFNINTVIQDKGRQISYAAKLLTEHNEELLLKWLQTYPNQILDLSSKTTSPGSSAQDNTGVEVYKYLLVNKQWDILELNIERMFLHNKNVGGKNPELWVHANSKVYSLAATLLENKKFDLIEKLVAIDPGYFNLQKNIIKVNDNGYTLSHLIVQTLERCQLFANLLKNDPIWASEFDLNDNTLWWLVQHKQYDTIDNLLKLKLTSQNAKKLNLSLKSDNPIFNDPDFINKINQYNDALELKEKQNKDVSAKKEQKVEPLSKIDLSALTLNPDNKKALEESPEVKITNKVTELFGDKLKLSKFEYHQLKSQFELQGTSADISNLCKIMRKYVPKTGKDNIVKETIRKKGQLSSCNLDGIKGTVLLDLFRNNQFLREINESFGISNANDNNNNASQVNVNVNDNNNSLDTPNNSLPLAKNAHGATLKPEELELWLNAIPPIFGNLQDLKVEWDKENNCYNITLKSIDEWQIPDYISDDKIKPKHDNLKRYKLPEDFLENMVSRLQTVLKPYATIELDKMTNTIKLTPKGAPPTNINSLRDDMLAKIKQKGVQTEDALQNKDATSGKGKGKTPSINKEAMSDNNAGQTTNIDDSKNYKQLSLDTVKELFKNITNDGQEFKFLNTLITKKKGRKCEIHFNFEGAQTIGGLDSVVYLNALCDVIDNAYPNLIRFYTETTPMKIILDSLEHDISNINANKDIINSIQADFKKVITAQSTKSMTGIDSNTVLIINNNNNNNNNFNNDRNAPKATIKLDEDTIYQAAYQAAQGKESSNNLSHHLTMLRNITKQKNCTPAETENNYFLYLVHLQSLMILLSGKNPNVYNIAFKNLRNIIRHAFLVPTFEREKLYSLMQSLISGLSQINKIKGFEPTKIQLFAPSVKLGIKNLTIELEKFNQDLVEHSLGKNLSADKEEIEKLYISKIKNIRNSLILPDTTKKKLTLILCSLIGETNKAEPFNFIYQKLGHNSDLSILPFEDIIEQIYAAREKMLEQLFPTNTPSPKANQIQYKT